MPTLAVIGGGAAGFFSAITAAEVNPDTRIHIFEHSKRVLAKVAISGGGRCNVTHACFDPRELVTRYPRGAKELHGAFHAWQPQDTIDWFQARGVALKTEADGRMFPTTDDSQTIIDCLTGEIEKLGISLHISTGVSKVSRQPHGTFTLHLSTSKTLDADRVIVTTGGGQASGGHQISRDFGHTIAPLAPSLFTFHIDDPLLRDLQGISIENASVRYAPAKLRQSGPILITHWGLSGPAILKLSAWGARVFQELDYRFEIAVNWLGDATIDEVRQRLEQAKSQYSRRNLGSANPFDFQKRFWERLLEIVSIKPDTQWAQLSKKHANQLAERIANTRFQVLKKSMNKEEFVTCGGVSLKEVDFKTMQSKFVPGLHFAGEVLDIDGITGGFNFQAAWTTARLAGLAASKGFPR